MKPAILAALLLTACAAKSPPQAAAPLHCPPVPQCSRPEANIRTNADLAQALIDTRAALAVCTIARDTLQACIDRSSVGAAHRKATE